MSAVARKLNALALGQADEARLAHEVATGAELASHEATALDAEGRAKLREAEVEFAPVVPVSASGDDVAELKHSKSKG